METIEPPTASTVRDNSSLGEDEKDWIGSSSSRTTSVGGTRTKQASDRSGFPISGFLSLGVSSAGRGPTEGGRCRIVLPLVLFICNTLDVEISSLLFFRAEVRPLAMGEFGAAVEGGISS